MFASPAFAQAAGAAPAGGGITAILIQVAPLVFLFAIFWFLILRPQQQRVKQHREMVAAVKKGDEVVTGGGLIGKVAKVADDEVEVELAPSVKVRVVKATLSSVTPRGGVPAANDAKG
jgi:preprotein translocase subunit YajC